MLAVSIFWHAANSRRSMLDSSFEFMGPFSYSVNAVVHLLKQLDRTVIASRLRVFSIRKETRDGWDVSDTHEQLHLLPLFQKVPQGGAAPLGFVQIRVANPSAQTYRISDRRALMRTPLGRLS